MTSTIAVSCQSHNIFSKLFHLFKTTLEQSSSFQHKCEFTFFANLSTQWNNCFTECISDLNAQHISSQPWWKGKAFLFLSKTYSTNHEIWTYFSIIFIYTARKSDLSIFICLVKYLEIFFCLNFRKIWSKFFCSQTFGVAMTVVCTKWKNKTKNGQPETKIPLQSTVVAKTKIWLVCKFPFFNCIQAFPSETTLLLSRNYLLTRSTSSQPRVFFHVLLQFLWNISTPWDAV